MQSSTELIDRASTVLPSGVDHSKQLVYRGRSPLQLSVRVAQVFCGVCCAVVSCTALIEEKHFNLSVGIVSGLLTVIASAVSIGESFRIRGRLTGGGGTGTGGGGGGGSGGRDGPAGMMDTSGGCKWLPALAVHCFRSLRQQVSPWCLLAWLPALLANFVLMARCSAILSHAHALSSYTLLTVCYIQLTLVVTILFCGVILCTATCLHVSKPVS